jgi:hypothetical protein
MPPNKILRLLAISLVGGLVSGLLLSEVSFYFLKTGETRPPQTILLTIPNGTAARVAQGEADPSIPSNMIFVVGDMLLVTNQDTVPHTLGPLYIPSKSSATMNLNVVQEYAFACSFTPSKYIGLSVQSPLDIWTRLFGIVEAGLPMGILIGLFSLVADQSKRKTSAA